MKNLKYAVNNVKLILSIVNTIVSKVIGKLKFISTRNNLWSLFHKKP